MSPDVDCTWDVAPPAAIVHRARPRVVRPRAHFVYKAPKPVEWVINCAPEDEAPPAAEIIVAPAPQYSVPVAPPSFEDGAQPSGEPEEEPPRRGHDAPALGETIVVYSPPLGGFTPAVPEPGIWALFAAGLGLLMLRRKS